MTPHYVKQRLKLKGYKQAHQDLQPSLMWRQVTCLLLKTIVDCPRPLCLCSRQEKEVSHKGEVDESQEDKLDLLLWNTEGLYTTALQLLTNLLSHVC
jgi:hypothetical protein